MRLWTIPEGTPFEELQLAKPLGRLRASTNLRADKDPGQTSGYGIDPDPIDSWEYINVPTR
jgi:hypothetical protein